MSSFLCAACDNLKNRKWDYGAHSDPRDDSWSPDLMCTDCYHELLEDLGMTEDQHEEKLKNATL